MEESKANQCKTILPKNAYNVWYPKKESCYVAWLHKIAYDIESVTS